MSQLLNVPPPFNVAVLIVAIIVVASTLCSTAWIIRAGIAHYLELQFKRDMIDRGFAPDEIERLVRARGESTSDCAAECDPAARRSRHAG